MSGWASARIQLCGRFVVVIDGARIEETLPGRRGRALFAFLVLNRGRALLRDELLLAGWGADASADARSALSVLLSKLRHGVGGDNLRGRTEIELLHAIGHLRGRRSSAGRRAPGGVLHRPRTVGRRHGVRPASRITSRAGPSCPDWRRPGSTAGGAGLTTSGCEGWRVFAAADLGLGGPGLSQAEERARMLTELAPYRETGHRILIEALEQRGNVAEALRAYERLRVLLRDELGVAPSPTLQAVHRRLLQCTAKG